MATIMHSSDAIEDADFKQVAVPSNLMILPDGCKRGGAIEHMSRSIPFNEYGLPLYYIRSDMLDLNMVCHFGRISQDDVDSAIESLNYQDGYPTLSNGSPFWTALPHEPHPAYVLFQKFLELDELEGIRLLDSLARMQQIDLQQVREYHQEFYWSSRARSYDLFLVAAEAKKREVRIRKTENKHFSAAGDILDAVIDKVNYDPELLDKMDAKELFNLFEQMVKVQRLSLGLVGQHSSSMSADMKTPGQSVEVILRSLTKNSGLEGQGADNFQNRLALLMSDENTAMQAQELIVRATSASGS